MREFKQISDLFLEKLKSEKFGIELNRWSTGKVCILFSGTCDDCQFRGELTFKVDGVFVRYASDFADNLEANKQLAEKEYTYEEFLKLFEE